MGLTLESSKSRRLKPFESLLKKADQCISFPFPGVNAWARETRLPLPQISSGHLLRFFNSQQSEHRWRDVFERAAFAQFYADRVFVN